MISFHSLSFQKGSHVGLPPCLPQGTGWAAPGGLGWSQGRRVLTLSSQVWNLCLSPPSGGATLLSREGPDDTGTSVGSGVPPPHSQQGLCLGSRAPPTPPTPPSMPCPPGAIRPSAPPVVSPGRLPVSTPLPHQLCHGVIRTSLGARAQRTAWPGPSSPADPLPSIRLPTQTCNSGIRRFGFPPRTQGDCRRLPKSLARL